MQHLPDFLVIGSARCGTSSLHVNLCKHPRIRGPNGLMGNGKEAHFFDTKWGKKGFPIEWYSGLFRGIPDGDNLFFESTPNYIFDPKVPERVKEILPAGKFILMLRDPVERAWSHFSHWKRKCKWNVGMMRSPKFNPVEKGVYHLQISRWLNFFRREQIMIIRSEDFYGNPGRVLKEVFSWIGVEPLMISNPVYWDPAPGRDGNEIRVKYEKIPVDLKRELRAFYRPHNQILEELIGKRLGWDRTATWRKKEEG